MVLEPDVWTLLEEHSFTAPFQRSRCRKVKYSTTIKWYCKIYVSGEIITSVHSPQGSSSAFLPSPVHAHASIPTVAGSGIVGSCGSHREAKNTDTNLLFNAEINGLIIPRARSHFYRYMNKSWICKCCFEFVSARCASLDLDVMQRSQNSLTIPRKYIKFGLTLRSPRLWSRNRLPGGYLEKQIGIKEQQKAVICWNEKQHLSAVQQPFIIRNWNCVDFPLFCVVQLTRCALINSLN